MAHPSTERPLSPHLTIYKPQITSMLSILHRITGIANAIGLLLLVGWLWALAFNEGCYTCIQEMAAHPIAKVLFIGWTFAFFYHLCNGVRHLFWDAGKGFDLCCVKKSGILVVALAATLTALTWHHIIQTVGF